MKVLIAAGLFPPETGGPATYAALIARELPQQEIETAVLPFSTVRGLPPVIRHIAYAFLLFRRSRGVDVIFAQDAVSVGLPARIVCMLTMKRFALRVGGDFAWEQGVQRYGVTDVLDDFVQKRQHGRVRRLQRIQSWVSRGADVVIVPSRYLKRIVETWGVEEPRIKVVYSAFVPASEAMKEDKESLRKRLGINGSAIVSAGRLVPWKGMQALIEIISSMPLVSLYIAGEGPELASLQALAKTTGVAERVHFLGALERSRLFEYIRAADVFVLNTGYEGMSYQLLEVMSLGTPIVTTPVGGNPEIIENGKEGVLVPFNDINALRTAINAVLSGDTRAMTAAAREKTAQFSSERMLKDTANILNSL